MSAPALTSQAVAAGVTLRPASIAEFWLLLVARRTPPRATKPTRPAALLLHTSELPDADTLAAPRAAVLRYVARRRRQLGRERAQLLAAEMRRIRDEYAARREARLAALRLGWAPKVSPHPTHPGQFALELS